MDWLPYLLAIIVVAPALVVFAYYADERRDLWTPSVDWPPPEKARGRFELGERVRLPDGALGEVVGFERTATLRRAGVRRQVQGREVVTWVDEDLLTRV